MLPNKSSKRAKLQNYLQRSVFNDQGLRIKAMTQAASGWTDETYIVKLQSSLEQTPRECVIRKLKNSSLLSAERSLLPQSQLLHILSSKSMLPVPKVYHYEQDSRILGGEFIVMEKLRGRSYVPWSLEGRAFLEEAAEHCTIPKQFVDNLVGLHCLNYREYGIQKIFEDFDSGYCFISKKITKIEELYNKYTFISDPVMIDALEWLKANRPSVQRLSIIHGDYRTGNMLYEGNKLTGILDWEAAEIGDPLMDVAYVCAKANRMDSRYLCYLLDREWFLAYYSQKTGLNMDANTLHYYEVLHHVWFLLLSLSAAYAFQKEKATDLRMARQGYRWALMRKLLIDSIGY